MTNKEWQQEFDLEVLTGLKSDVETAANKLKKFENSCHTCRAFYDPYVRRFRGGMSAYSIGFKQIGEAVYCPDCNRCIYARD